MRPRTINAPATDLDLRIKAGAALTCDLSTRVRGSNPTDASASRPVRSIDLVPSGVTDRSWLRALVYVVFAIAIAIPWALLLADQLFG
jgi:hypothetical protein